MRIVTIDSGNTNQTIALHNEQGLLSVCNLNEFQFMPDDLILISNVGKLTEIKPSIDFKKYRTDNSFLDMNVNYSKTLGEDRLFAAYSVYKKLETNEKILLIDAGTFITMDVVSKEGFQGGFIFPGVSRFLESFSQSNQLPSFKVDEFISTASTHLPNNTKEAILNATNFYLMGIFEQVSKAASPSRIILTGGSAEYLNKVINLEVPFELTHHLVHLGLAQSFEFLQKEEFYR